MGEPISNGEKTVEKNRGKLFEPGNNANPTGRPKGSRNKLGEDFIKAMSDDFAVHGVGVVEEVRKTKPDQYLKVIASLLPKEVKIVDERELSNDELLERIRQLDTIIQPFLISFGEEETGRGASTPHRAN